MTVRAKHLAVILLGLISGLVGSLIGINILLRSDNFSLRDINSQLASIQNQVSQPPNVWEKISAESSLSSVAIQVFKDNKLLRQGSGIIISDDGLILSTADVLIDGEIYQVFQGESILKGRLVTRNFALNLAILKVEKTGLTVSNFYTSSEYRSGTEVLLFGKNVNLSQAIDFSQKGLISYIQNKSISIDANFNSSLSGSKVIDSKGNIIGMVFLRFQKIYMIGTPTINEFIEANII